MKLSLFLSGVSVLSSNFDPDSLDATGISTDSRTVRPGELFICLDGTSFDGADYISEASAAGACAVVVRRGRRVPDGVRYLEVASTRYCAAQIWNNFCSAPDGMNIIAVTGRTVRPQPHLS
ncbi:MAG: Mur ligase domain-containing protein [Lachnospiraceae bacterium]